MDKELKYTKTESENFVFPAKHLPNCFYNIDLLNELETIIEQYDDSLAIIKDNFDISGDKIKGLICLKNNIYNTKKGGEPINFTISKPNGGKRIMSVVNPLFLIPLHQYMLDNKDIILEEQEESNELFDAASHFNYQDGGYMVERTYEDDIIVKLYQGHYYQNDYITNMINKLKISNGKYYCLKIDISSFFNSIYTHTISWYIKDEKNIILFENLDVLNRTLNNNETKGIVVGPYTSSLFSEILLSKIDRELFVKFQEDNIYYQRYCDDYKIFSDSKEIFENIIIPYIEGLLSKYKLEINYSKLIIEEFPFIINDEENLQEIIDRIKMCMHSDKDEIIKIDKMIYEISKITKRKYSDINYVLSALIKWDVWKFEDQDNIKVLLDFLINLIFRNNLVAKYTMDLIIKIININSYDAANIIKDWILKRNRLSYNNENINDIWLIYLIVYLNIKEENSNFVKNYLLDVLGNNQLTDILVIEYLYKNDFIIDNKKIIKKYLDSIEEDFKLKYSGNIRDCYFTKYWLLFYTNSIRWKLHEIQGFKESILKRCFIEEIINTEKRKKELNILYKMYEQGVELFII